MKSAYIYDLNLLKKTVDLAKETSNEFKIKLHYALKANNNDTIIKIISKKLNVDCVSIQEIELALKYWKANQIVFAGSGKKRTEIDKALEYNIKCLHIESVSEFEYALKRKHELNSNTNLVLRININIAADTHEKITTGKYTNKFGIIDKDAIKLINKYGNEIYGIHTHSGSQITDVNWFLIYAKTVKVFLDKIINYGFNLKYLNMGGGLGIDYTDSSKMPDFKGWMMKIRQILPVSYIKDLRLEPGRSIVGQCGNIHAQVQWIKDNNKLILDVGMSDILRPALYDARHNITRINNGFGNVINYNIFGPSCESSDYFGSYQLNELKELDYINIHSTGAYVQSMRLNYNLRTELPTIFV